MVSVRLTCRVRCADPADHDPWRRLTRHAPLLSENARGAEAKNASGHPGSMANGLSGAEARPKDAYACVVSSSSSAPSASPFSRRQMSQTCWSETVRLIRC